MTDGRLPGFETDGAGGVRDQWYTPDYILDAARAALGGEFDLDPASCAEAQKRVRATRWHSPADDGLAAPWSARRVWLNPPYSNPEPWIDRLVDGWRTGAVGSGAIILNATSALGNKYSPRLLEAVPLMATVRRRVEFIPGPGIKKADGGRDASVIAVGGRELDRDVATHELAAVGIVWRRESGGEL